VDRSDWLAHMGVALTHPPFTPSVFESQPCFVRHSTVLSREIKPLTTRKKPQISNWCDVAVLECQLTRAVGRVCRICPFRVI
jgi:hypothetical protein